MRDVLKLGAGIFVESALWLLDDRRAPLCRIGAPGGSTIDARGTPNSPLQGSDLGSPPQHADHSSHPGASLFILILGSLSTGGLLLWALVSRYGKRFCYRASFSLVQSRNHARVYRQSLRARMQQSASRSIKRGPFRRYVKRKPFLARQRIRLPSTETDNWRLAFRYWCLLRTPFLIWNCVMRVQMMMV